MSSKQFREVVVVGMARSPIGDFGGALSTVPAVELAKTVAKAAMDRAGVAPGEIDEVTLGTVYKHGMKGNPARQVQIALGDPRDRSRLYGGAAVCLQPAGPGDRGAADPIGQDRRGAGVRCGEHVQCPHMMMGLRQGGKDGPPRSWRVSCSTTRSSMCSAGRASCAPPKTWRSAGMSPGQSRTSTPA